MYLLHKGQGYLHYRKCNKLITWYFYVSIIYVASLFLFLSMKCAQALCILDFGINISCILKTLLKSGNKLICIYCMANQYYSYIKSF